MKNILLYFLGVRTDDGGTLVGVDFEFHPAVRWSVVLVLILFALGVAFASYRRRDVELTKGRRLFLFTLRAVALVVLSAILLRPGLGLDVEGLVRQELVLLLDESASMRLRDPRTEPADQVRAALATGRVSATGGLQQPAPPLTDPRPSREELLRATLTNKDLALIERLSQGFDLQAMGFAGGLQALETTDAQRTTNSARQSFALLSTNIAASLRSDGSESAPGTALREVLERERGRPLGGIVLFTDGIRNTGSDLREATELAREARVPVQVVALGTTDPRDLQVVELSAPDVAFVRDEVQVSALLRARGLVGQTVHVRLDLDGTPVEEKDIAIAREGETIIPFQFTPSQVGDFEIAVEAPARPDEILAENNRATRRLRVVEDRIRVLLVEQSPRWEFRYLQALLLRDRRVDMKCVLFDGDPAISRGQGSPYLEAFPARREDLFTYDLIVFGDVDPRNFTPAQIEVLADFIARGGGSFLMVAGRRFSPWGYRDTPLERMLPVEFDRVPTEAAGSTVHDTPVKLTLTADGRSSPLLRLSEDPAENQSRWDALPPLFWVAPVGSAKPAAQVLVVAENQGAGGVEATPVMALQQYGVGRTMFIGTDNTWRWRRNEGEQFFISFWGRVVQRLAIHHLLSGSRRTQLSLERTSAHPGERVGVSARLFTTAFEPLAEPSVNARLEGPDGAVTTGAATDIILRAVPDQPGLFHAELVAPSPGRYQLRVGEDAPVSVDFTVESLLVEAGETAMQEASLRELAQGTGGGFFREEDLHRLPDAAKAKAQKVRSRRAIELWSSPLYFTVVLLSLSLEWLLRKLWQLK